MKEREEGHTSGSPERPPRQVNAPVQLTRLADEAERVLGEREWRGADHMAITVRRTPTLRQVVIGMRRDGQIREHRAEGEVAIHVLSGEIVVEVEGGAHPVREGELLNLAPNLAHNVTARRESVFLLTIGPV
jgi:quercetin dioxygenase-like cupin family protein